MIHPGPPCGCFTKSYDPIPLRVNHGARRSRTPVPAAKVRARGGRKLEERAGSENPFTLAARSKVESNLRIAQSELSVRAWQVNQRSVGTYHQVQLRSQLDRNQWLDIQRLAGGVIRSDVEARDRFNRKLHKIFERVVNGLGEIELGRTSGRW